ncbi:uncharacterized protein LOC144148341 [Haemaphysalis longicornis]
MRKVDLNVLFSPQQVTDHGLEKATVYLATNLLADVVFILSMHGKIEAVETSKARYCFKLTYKCLAFTWAYLAARLLSPDGASEVLEDMFNSMKTAFFENVDAFAWLQGKDRREAEAVAARLGLDIVTGKAFRVPGADYSGEPVDERSGAPPEEESGHFLPVLVAALSHHFRVLSKNPPTRLQLLISELEFSSKLAYIAQRDRVLVPTHFQLEHYLYPSWVPDYYNYATMGYLLANQLAAVMGVGELSVTDKHRTSWDNATVSRHEAVLQCLLAKRKQLGFGELDERKADKQTALMMTLSHGIRLAYMALKKLFRDQAHTDKLFRSYWPEAQHVFFVRTCMIWCTSESKADPLTPREKCMLPLYSMREFSEHYNCANSVDTTSNASTPGFCDI